MPIIACHSACLSRHTINAVGILIGLLYVVLSDRLFAFDFGNGIEAVNRLQIGIAAERSCQPWRAAYHVAVIHIIADQLAFVVIADKAARHAVFTGAVLFVGRAAAVYVIARSDTCDGAAVDTCAVALDQVDDHIGVFSGITGKSVFIAGQRNNGVADGDDRRVCLTAAFLCLCQRNADFQSEQVDIKQIAVAEKRQSE